MLQRRFSIGYNKASRIVDQMQDAGFISEREGMKPRKIYITMEQFKEMFGDNDL